MLLSGVLFVLFLAGCWLYCLTDAALTPAEEFPGWRKRTWLLGHRGDADRGRHRLADRPQELAGEASGRPPPRT